MRATPAADGKEAVELFGDSLWRLVVDARREAATAGARYVQASAVRAGLAAPDVPLPGYSPDAVRTVLREAWRGPDPWNQVASRLATHVKDAGRQTVRTGVQVLNEDQENREKLAQRAASREQEASERAERRARAAVVDAEWADLDEEFSASNVTAFQPRRVGWARVLRGDTNCPFCVMLASRGPVYGSAEAAGQTLDPNIEGFLNSYHDNCDCQVVMVTLRSSQSWEGAAQAAAARKVYEEAVQRLKDPEFTEGYKPRSAKNPRAAEVLAAIRDILAEREAEGHRVVIPSYVEAA